MLVILLILFFTILLLYQLYCYLTPIREGLDDSTCVNQQLNDMDKRITALEGQLSNFHLDDVESTLVDLCNNVTILMQQSQAQSDALINQANDVQQSSDVSNVSTDPTATDDTTNFNDIAGVDTTTS